MPTSAISDCTGKTLPQSVLLAFLLWAERCQPLSLDSQYLRLFGSYGYSMGIDLSGNSRV